MPRVVIIGAGVVGAALADELSVRGWTDVTVVDQGELPAPGGSSSHAPGLVFQTNGSKVMAELARYTVEKLSALEYKGEPCYLPVGGLEIATTPERLQELHRRHGWAQAWGLDSRLLSVGECLEMWPLLAADVVLGGLHLPTDGLAKAVRAVNAQLDLARSRGVRVLDRTEVTGFVTEPVPGPGLSSSKIISVTTTAGELPADVVVCAAGIWGPKVAALAGLDLPLTPLAHQLAWTGPVPGLAGTPSAASIQAGTPRQHQEQMEQEATRPILRHQDADLYYRERFDGIGIGYYGHKPMPVLAEDIAPVDAAPVMPSVLEFTPADFAPAWQETQRLLPGTASSEITEAINGLFSFTTDDFPLLGPSRDVEGFWFAEAVWVTHSAGVGKAVAEWLVDGRSTSFDLHECDVNRFWPHQVAPQFVLERSSQNFVEVYDIKHPLEPMQSPRPIRTTPFHPRQVSLGASFLEASGWERPQWYEANAGLVAGRSVPAVDEWAAKYWSPIAVAEAQVTRERVAMYDMTALQHLEVSGPGAAAFLNSLVTANVDKSIGSVTYCLMLDDGGGIRSDVTVTRLGRDLFQVGGNGPLDVDWMLRSAPADVSVRDVTSGTCCIGLWGPLAREVLQPLTRTDVGPALKYFRGVQLHVGNVPVTALRLSYVGELGWELYTTSDLGLKLWDTLWSAGQEHGIIAAGRAAFTSMRLEKGYRSFGTDMTYEHSPWEAGLGFAVKAAKTGYRGEVPVLARRDAISRQLTCLVVSPDETSGTEGILLGKEPVFSADGECVGYVTSAGWGATIGAAIAYAWLPTELTLPGTQVSVGYFDRRLVATVSDEPLFDPKMERLRG